jgi:acetyl esterase/lipase
MAYKLDPDFLAASQKTFQELGIPPNRPIPRFPKGDVDARRKRASFAKVLLALEPEVPNVSKTTYTILREDGYGLLIFVCRKETEKRSSDLKPAVLYLHGGGMIFSSTELFEPVIKADVAATGVTYFSV